MKPSGFFAPFPFKAKNNVYFLIMSRITSIIHGSLSHFIWQKCQN